MKKIFLLIMLLCVAPATAKIPETLKGNWIDTKTGEWIYGFFDEFAIADTNFWEYAAIDNGQITLSNVENSILLTVKPNKNGTLTIKNGGKQTTLERGMPQFKTADNTPFSEPTITPGKAVLRGVLHGFDRIPEHLRKKYGNPTFGVSATDIVSEESEDYTTTIDPLGRFVIEIPLLGTQEVWVDWERLGTKIVLQPGDEQMLFVELSDICPPNEESFPDFLRRDRPMLFMGTNARLSNEMSQFNNLWLDGRPFDTARQNRPSGMDYFRQCEQRYNNEKAHYEKFVAAHPQVSERFRFYQTESMKFDFANNLMMFNLLLMRTEGERLPYMDYVAENFPLNDPRVWLLIRPFDSFARHYVAYESYLRTPKEFADKGMVIHDVRVIDTVLHEIPLLRQMRTATFYHDDIDNQRLPLTEPELAQLDERITNPYLRERLHARSDYFATLQNREMEHAESLHSAAEVAGITDPAELLGKLVAPHRGKVVYIDIWGTWCGPCRENMKVMPEIEDEFEGEDVVFLCLANRSPEEQWRNLIKEMNLTGPSVVHYNLPEAQQKALEGYLKVRKWPTYMLIGRDGELLDADAPSPLHRRQLIDALYNALEE